MGTPEEEEQRRSGIMEGFRYVRSNRIIVSLIALIALNTIFIFPAISVMLPLYVRDILHLGRDKHGMDSMAVSGIGAFLGSIGLLSVARENRAEIHDRQCDRHCRGCVSQCRASARFCAYRLCRWALWPLPSR